MKLTPDVQSARRRFVLVAVVVPVVMTAIAVVLMVVWIPELPATVAMHWSGGGPDGFAPVWVAPVLVGALGVGLPGLFASIVLISSRGGEWGPTFRFLGAVVLGTTTLLVIGITWSLGMQRGLEDARDAPSVLVPLAVGAGLGVLAGIAAWFAQPKLVASGEVGDSGATAPTVGALQLVPGERAVWARTTMMSKVAMFGLAAVVAALVVGTIVLGATGSAGWWAMLASTLLLLLLTGAIFVFRVRVDRAGLTVRSAVGVPRFRIPLDDVAEARVVIVSPMAEFGGWGLRVGLDGRFGVVLRAGEALQVTRRDNRVFVVAVDDATTAAALLVALSEQAIAAKATGRASEQRRR